MISRSVDARPPAPAPSGSESDEVGGGGGGVGAQGGAPARVTAVATASASGATPSGSAPGKRRRVVTLARWEPSAFVRMLTAVDVSTHRPPDERDEG